MSELNKHVPGVENGDGIGENIPGKNETIANIRARAAALALAVSMSGVANAADTSQSLPEVSTQAPEITGPYQKFYSIKREIDGSVDVANNNATTIPLSGPMIMDSFEGGLEPIRAGSITIEPASAVDFDERKGTLKIKAGVNIRVTFNFNIPDELLKHYGFVVIAPVGLSSPNSDGVFTGTLTEGHSKFHIWGMTGGKVSSYGNSREVEVVADQPPVLQDDSFSMAHDQTSITLDPLANDNDPDGDSLSIEAVQVLSGSNLGTVSLTPDQKIKFDRNTTESGIVEIEYRSGGQSATITLTIAETPNQAPTLTVQPVSTNEDTAVNLNDFITATDVDGDDLTVTFGTPLNGTITTTGVYTPNENYHGTDRVVARFSDGTHMIEKTIDIIVNPENDAPTIDSITGLTNGVLEATVGEAITPVVIQLNDIDGDMLTTIVTNLPSGLTSSYDSNTKQLTISGTPDSESNGNMVVAINDGTTETTKNIAFKIEANNTITPTINLQLDGVIEINPNEYESGSLIPVVFDATGTVDPDGVITHMVVMKDGVEIYNGSSLSFSYTAIGDYGKIIDYDVMLYGNNGVISQESLQIKYYY